MWHGFRHGSVYYTYPYTYVIHGDTIISGKTYKKRYGLDAFRWRDYEMHYDCAVREEEEKLFCVESGKTEELMLIDLDMQPGESWVVKEDDNGRYIHTVVANEVKSISHWFWGGPYEWRVVAVKETFERKLYREDLGDDTDNQPYFFIEGLGFTYATPMMYGWAGVAGSHLVLQDCYDSETHVANTEMIRQIEQEMQEAVTQIEQAEATGKKSSAGIYDLEGRRLPAEPRAGQVYIKDGRKQVGR